MKLAKKVLEYFDVDFSQDEKAMELRRKYAPMTQEKLTQEMRYLKDVCLPKAETDAQKEEILFEIKVIEMVMAE